MNRGLGTDQYVQFAGETILQKVVRISILSPLILCFVMEGIMCLQNYATDFVETLNAVGLFLTFLSASLIYGCLILKSKEIVELFNYLDGAVTSSNESFFHFLWSVKIYEKWNLVI